MFWRFSTRPNGACIRFDGVSFIRWPVALLLPEFSDSFSNFGGVGICWKAKGGGCARSTRGRYRLMVSAVNTSITKPPPRRRKSHRKETFHESWGGPSARRSRRSTRGVVFLSVGSRSALLPRCFRGVAIGEGLAATRAPGALSPKSKIAEPIQLRRCHRDLPSSLTSPLHTNR